ncbi:hypothetical protein, partial [Pseudomonas aeruginosa]|uniref:hypothetical protein n=1 Tax=Pseudomonas aeruginosa TaxID=287 RepID=UPI0039685CE6
MDDTLRFASRLCKFIVAASFLLVAVASLCLWWTGQAYEYAALAFFPFAVPMLLLIMISNLLTTLNGSRR